MLIAVTLCHCLDCSDERNDTDERNDKRDRELEEGTSVSQESRVKIHNKNKRAAGCAKGWTAHHSKMAQGPTKTEAMTSAFQGRCHMLRCARYKTRSKLRPQNESTTAGTMTETWDALVKVQAN